jgi:phage gp29-like protein
MSVFELNWYNAGGYWYPRPLERDYRTFNLLDGKLVYRFTEVDQRKVIHLTHRAKFNAKLGRPLYATLFWLRRFKAASMEFWMEFMERFGKPWVIGKTDADKNAMAQELYAMLAGDVAVIEPEDQIDLKSPADKGSFKEILDYIDDQIREAITGGNLTGSVRGGSYAAAKTHKEIGKEIALADTHLLTEAISEVITKFKDLNAYTQDITFDLVDKDNPNIDLATRDKVLADLMKGRFVFSEAYLKQTYNIDFETQPQPTIQGSALPFSATPKIPHDPIDQFLSDTDTQPEEDALLNTIKKVFTQAQNYEEAYNKLLNLYTDIDEVKLLEAFEKYLQTALLYGNAEAESEDAKA